MQRVAIIVCNKPAEWVSCRAITRNLAEAYLLLPDYAFEFVQISSQATAFEMYRAASYLREKGFNKIIFIEHAPNPCPLVQALFEQDPHYKPELIFHAFGDFVLNAPAWFGAEKILEKYPVQFVCASDRQAKLLRSLVACQENQIVTIPFPVSASDFYFDPKIRQDFRQSQNWDSDLTVFLYTGRLSSQKNIIQLLKAFETYQRQIQPHSILCLAGSVDDLGTPYIGKKSLAGLMNYNVQKVIHELYPAGQSPILYLGDLQSHQLNQVYNGSDVFVSLSTHNDEDFGMAPAEALMTGLYSVLSDWGGYSQFNKMAPQNSILVPVELDAKKVAPSVLQSTKALILAASKLPQQDRARSAVEFTHQLSKEYISLKMAENLKSYSAKTGIKMTPLMRKVAQCFTIQPQAPFGSGENYSQLYQEVYDVYRS